jgi:hypothetical protein
LLRASPYVTFYKAIIPRAYLLEFKDGLPRHQSIEILRWPKENNIFKGLNLAEPEGRREVLETLARLSQYLKIVY